ncbi:response regulator transcription factor [Mesorhizobium sp. MSK_1335]|uniref:Response regulator transcription factor n=1 Tax=Mesorhizobium montanum TaxID=3072323 RepID=A0ABU4ZVJ0_9HYPH|nr:response regulator transcription factor [Mesorhizobium sp. MSK_1335]MDX8527966.1 response regulator transcription factor [Mesorhizobium sp. MSK_1335]
MKPLVLICSQDAEFYLFLSHILEVDGFSAELIDVEDAVPQAAEREPQAVVLDCLPAGAIGPTICARLKSEVEAGAVRVVALIAPGAEHQHVELIKTGIDESFMRPFAPAKLLAYLRRELAVARLGLNGRNGRESLNCGPLEIRLASHRVNCNGEQLHLGPIEYNLLCYLIENPGKVCFRDELVHAAWPHNIHVGPRTVDVHISRLRKTLAPHNFIRTIRSAGYALEEQED